MGRRFWMVLDIILITGLAIFLFLVWRPGGEKEKVLEEGPAAGIQQPISESQKLPQKEPELVFVEPEIPKLIFSAEGAGSSQASGGKPFFEEEEEKFSETFLKRFSSLTKPPEIPSPVSVTTTEEIPGGGALEVQPKKTLTDEEYFKNLYPERIATAFNGLQDIMVQEGYIKENEKTTIKTEEDLYSFTLFFANYLIEEGFLDKEKKLEFEKSIEELRKLNAAERPAVEKQFLNLNFRQFFFEILALLVPNAYAQVDCYRIGVYNPVPGINMVTPGWCCECGLNWVRIHHRWRLRFFDNCPAPTCAVPTGCLNLICPPPLPAIWDPFLNICGCG